MIQHCPTCDSVVEAVTTDEGTSHYRPLELDLLRDALLIIRSQVLDETVASEATTGDPTTALRNIDSIAREALGQE